MHIRYDNRADDLTKEGMRQGIETAAVFLLFLSKSVLERPFCQFEIREAVALKKPMLLIHESDSRFGAFDFGSAGATAPADLKVSRHQADTIHNASLILTCLSRSSLGCLSTRNCSIATSQCHFADEATSEMECCRL